MNKEKPKIQILFGENVRKYRKKNGLTQEQFSEQLGISQKHLSIIETGTQFASEIKNGDPRRNKRGPQHG